MSDPTVTIEEGLAGIHAQTPQERPRSWRVYWRRLLGRPAALVGTVIFCIFVFLAVFGPWVAPYDYQAQDAEVRLEAPSASHPFGTDQFGRDIFSRVIVGARNIFLIGGLGTLIAVIIGTAIGLGSGYVGGAVDEVVMRLLDVLLSFPSLLLALVLLGTVGPSNINIVFVVAVLYTPMVARVVRSMVLDLKNKEFVEAARIRGERRSYVLFREILPNSLPPLLVEASMRFSYSVFLVASLGYLGLGVQPPSPDWGLQINEGRNFFSIAPWVLLFPAFTIALLVVATNLMSDGLRQVMLPGGGRR
ncbi:MAG: ABC transporter permease [Actinobacteria bacterium]|nr:MAG: ABC transporter permease [Actinomycetota bacterium]